MSRKITKIVINILQKNSDNERYLQNAWKQAIFEILSLYYLKFQIPTACGLTIKRWFFILVRKWIDLWNFHKLEQSRIFGSKWLLLEFRRVDVWMEKSHSSRNFRNLFRRWLYKNNSSHVSQILHERWGDRRNNTCSCFNYYVRFGMKIIKNWSFFIL